MLMSQAAMFGFEWWTEPLGSWMAWTRATAAFFLFIIACITAMGVWEYFSPGGNPRRGVFAIDTTRGDRLFLSLPGYDGHFEQQQAKTFSSSILEGRPTTFLPQRAKLSLGPFSDLPQIFPLLPRK